MQDRPNIRPETLQALLDSAMDSRRLGGYSRAKRIVSRLTGREIKTLRDMRDLFSSMLEEDAATLLVGLQDRMPDLTKDTVHATVLRMQEAA